MVRLDVDELSHFKCPMWSNSIKAFIKMLLTQTHVMWQCMCVLNTQNMSAFVESP